MLWRERGCIVADYVLMYPVRESVGCLLWRRGSLSSRCTCGHDLFLILRMVSLTGSDRTILFLQILKKLPLINANTSRGFSLRLCIIERVYLVWWPVLKEALVVWCTEHQSVDLW